MKPSGNDRLYTISELAAEFGISPRSIRFYEEKELIEPQRTSGNQRVYTKRDRARLKLILRGKRFGYSLEEISEMIGMTNAELNEVTQIDTSLAYGERKLREIHDRINELQLLEKDILSVREKLIRRLSDIKKGERHESGANGEPER